jgi:hypothetical protein
MKYSLEKSQQRGANMQIKDIKNRWGIIRIIAIVIFVGIISTRYKATFIIGMSGLALIFQDWMFMIYKLYDDIIANFSPEDYYSSIHCKWLFQHLYGQYWDGKKLPKLAVRVVYTQLSLWLIHSVVLPITIIVFDNPDIIELELVFYVSGIMIIQVYFDILGKTKCFFYKFKKLNRKNCVYLIRRILFTDWKEKEINPIFQGKCTIITIAKKKNKYYAEVQMIKSSVKHRDILLSNEKRINDNDVKSLYEICGVKYID